MRNVLQSFRTGLMAVSLAVGLLSLAPGRIQAQPTTVNITLTATYQNPNFKQPANTDITATGTESVSFSPASIQTLISNSLGMSLKGYTLVYDSFTTGFYETNSKTGDVQDVSTILTFNNDLSGSGDFVTSGTSDTTDPIAQTLITTSEGNLTFDDGNGNAFNVIGLLKLTVSLNSLSATQITNGVTQTETISLSWSATGYGTVVDKKGNTDNAVFSGTISGSGKGPAGS